jgi:cyclopropane fatty-acyl-phospholipid synthase-like methyltransferase
MATSPVNDGCDINNIRQMYGKDHSTVTQLFPEEDQGCINFGYWPGKENMPAHSISKPERTQSQHDLYNQLFKDAGITSSDRVLEVGCGRGHGVAWGSEKAARYEGIDLLDKQVEKAQTSYPTLKDRFSVQSADNIQFANGTFDKVVSLEAAQHFPDFRAFANQASRVLKSDGTLTVCTFFYKGAEGERVCKSEMPTNELALDHTIQLDQAKEDLESAGLRVETVRSIGAHTFHGFCTWAKQVRVTTPHTLKWVTMFDQGAMDYCTIVARKSA